VGSNAKELKRGGNGEGDEEEDGKEEEEHDAVRA